MQLLACVAVCVTALSVTAAGFVAQRPLFQLPSASATSRSDVLHDGRRSSETTRTNDGISTVHSAPTQQQGLLTALPPSLRDSALRQDAIVLQGTQTTDDSTSPVSLAGQALHHQAPQFNLPPELIWQLQQQGLSVQGSPNTFFARRSNQPAQALPANTDSNNFQSNFQQQFPSQFLSNVQVAQQHGPQQQPTAFLSLASPLQSQDGSQFRFAQANQSPIDSNSFIQTSQQPQNFQNIPIFHQRSNNFQQLPQNIWQLDNQVPQFQHQPQQQIFSQQNVQHGATPLNPTLLTQNSNLLNGQLFQPNSQQVSPKFQTNTQQIRTNPFQFRLHEMRQSFTPVSPVQQTVTQTVFVPVLRTDLPDVRPVPSEPHGSLSQNSNQASLSQKAEPEILPVKQEDLPKSITIQTPRVDKEQTQIFTSAEKQSPLENQLPTEFQPDIADEEVTVMTEAPIVELVEEGTTEQNPSHIIDLVDFAEEDNKKDEIVSSQPFGRDVERENTFVIDTQGLQKEQPILKLNERTDDTEGSPTEITPGLHHQNAFEPSSLTAGTNVDDIISLNQSNLDTEFNNTFTNETQDLQEEIHIVDDSTAAQQLDGITMADDALPSIFNLTNADENEFNEDGQTTGGDKSLSSVDDQEIAINDNIVNNIADSITESSTVAVTSEEMFTTVAPDSDLFSVVSDTPFSYEETSIPEEAITTESSIFRTDAPIITSASTVNIQPIITESTVSQRIHHNNIQIIKEHLQPDSFDAFQQQLLKDSFHSATTADFEEVTEIIATEENESNNVFLDEFFPNSSGQPESVDDTRNLTENIIYDELLGEANTASIGFPEYDYNLDSNDGTTFENLTESESRLLESLNALSELTTQNIIENDYPTDYDDNLQFNTEPTGVDETTFSNDATTTSAPTEKSVIENIPTEIPRIVERTVISISTTTNQKPTKRNVSSADRSEDEANTDVEISDITQGASSEHIPTFTIFVNPRTGRIFKRSTTAVPSGNIDSLISSIFEKRERDLGSANPRFPRRQGLFTLFNEKRNSNQNDNEQEMVDKTTQSTAEDVVEKEEQTSGSEGRLLPRNRSRLLALRKTRAKTASESNSRSFSSRFTKQDEVTVIPVEVTTAAVEISTESTNTDLDTVTETVLPGSDEKIMKDDKDNASVKKLSLEEQLKVLLRNKSTQDKVRKRLLSPRTPSFRLSGRKVGNQDAQSSDAVETKTLPDKPDMAEEENANSGPRNLRFNRFRNQNGNPQERRNDRVRLLASRFRNRKNGPGAQIASTSEEPAEEVKKPEPNKALQSGVFDSPRPRFKATRFEGFRRRNVTRERRPFVFTPTVSTTTPIPSVLASFISDIKDDLEETTSGNTENHLQVTTEDSIMTPERQTTSSEFVTGHDVITFHPPTSVATEIDTFTAPSFIEKFTEFLDNPTESSSKSSEKPETDEKKTDINKELLINTKITVMGNQVFSPFVPTDLPPVPTEFVNLSPSLFAGTTVNIPIEDTTKQFNVLFNEHPTESLLGNFKVSQNDFSTESGTSTVIPSTPLHESTETTQHNNRRVTSLENTEAIFIRGSKIVHANLPPISDPEIPDETVSDIFSKMLMSISKPQAILETMNAHVPIEIVNLRNANRAVEELHSKNVLTKSPPSKAGNPVDPPQLITTTQDVKQSGVENLSLTTGISVSSLAEEISKRTNRFRPSVHNLGSIQRKESFENTQAPSLEVTKTVEPFILETDAPSFVPSIRPVLVETPKIEQGGVITDFVNEDTQSTEKAFVLHDSILAEDKLLRSKNTSVINQASKRLPEGQGLKHELMRGNFSLLIDGTLLEEVMVKQRLPTKSVDTTSGVRLFDVPVMMNIPKISQDTEPLAILPQANNFVSSNEKSPAPEVVVLPVPDNKISNVFEQFVIKPDAESQGKNPSSFHHSEEFVTGVTLNPVLTDHAESLSNNDSPIDQFVAEGSSEPHQFETNEPLFDESSQLKAPVQFSAGKVIDSNVFVTERSSSRPASFHRQRELPTRDELDPRQSRDDETLGTKPFITNPQNEFVNNAVFQRAQLKNEENLPNQVKSSLELFSGDSQIATEQHFQLEDNHSILTAFEETTQADFISTTEMTPTHSFENPTKAPLFHELFPLFPRENDSGENTDKIDASATTDSTVEEQTIQFSALSEDTTERIEATERITSQATERITSQAIERIETTERITSQELPFLQNFDGALPILPNKINIVQRAEKVLKPVKVDQFLFAGPTPPTIKIPTELSERKEKAFSDVTVQIPTSEATADLFVFQPKTSSDEAKSFSLTEQLITTTTEEAFESFVIPHSQNFRGTPIDITSETNNFDSNVFVDEVTLTPPQDRRSFAHSEELGDFSVQNDKIASTVESTTTESFNDVFGFIFTEQQEPVTEINLSESPISEINTEFLNGFFSTLNDDTTRTRTNSFDHSTTNVDEVLDHLMENQEIVNIGKETFSSETVHNLEAEQSSTNIDSLLSTVPNLVAKNDNIDFGIVPSSVQQLIPRVVLSDFGQSRIRDSGQPLPAVQKEIDGINPRISPVDSGFVFNSAESNTPATSPADNRIQIQKVLPFENQVDINAHNTFETRPGIEKTEKLLGSSVPVIPTELDSDVLFSGLSEEANKNGGVLRPVAVSEVHETPIRNNENRDFHTSLPTTSSNEAVFIPVQQNHDAFKMAQNPVNKDVTESIHQFGRKTVSEEVAIKNIVPENLVTPIAESETGPKIAQNKVIRITSLTLLTPSPPLRPQATPFPRKLIPRPLQSNFIVKPPIQQFNSKQIQDRGRPLSNHNTRNQDSSKNGDVSQSNFNRPHDEIASESVSSSETITANSNEPVHQLPATIQTQPNQLPSISLNENNFENAKFHIHEDATKFTSTSTEKIDPVAIETTTEEMTTISTPRTVGPIITSTTESIVQTTTDTLHNFTNDELLILDLLADIVDPSPTSTAEIPAARTRRLERLRTSNREPSTQNISPQNSLRDSKAIDTPKRVFSSQQLQFASKETHLDPRQPPVQVESSDPETITADRVVIKKTIFPPPLPQFPQMPTITTPKPVFRTIPRRTNDRSPRLNQKVNSTPAPFGFVENFPFHVFDSFTSHKPVRQRSVSSSRGNNNAVSPNFSFFQIFNPPQAARLESKITAPDTTPFPLSGRSRAASTNVNVQPQRQRNINERSITSEPSRTQTVSRSLEEQSNNHRREEQSATVRPKIVSMRTKSGSLFFVPEERVAETMRLGMGMPLNLSNSPSSH